MSDEYKEQSSYFVRIVRGTASVAMKVFTLAGDGLEYLTSPTTTMINTRQDHDERHKSLHNLYKSIRG